jgi:murein tripeptide amidase MpaA
MKVLMFSEKKLEQEKTGWYRAGEDISYFQNNFRREHMTNY